ncbi:ATP-binding protein [bacterium]|nr:ATP-binding protein [bacterium]
MRTLIRKYKRLQKEYIHIYERDFFKSLESEHKIVGITGNRGIGKTTYLFYYLNKYYSASDQALYVSMDDIYFSKNSLIELVEKFIDEYDGKVICIDEIHRYPGWAQELKNIYDEYHKKIKIIFSGSSATDLIKQKYDLSRRATLKIMPGFSFREYLEFRQNVKLPILSLENVVENRTRIDDKILSVRKISGLFKEYLRIGYYPIFSEFKNEESVFDALSGIIDKMINIDIATYYSLKTETLPVFKKILYFIFTSSPGSINISKLSNSLDKSFPDTSRYIEMARESGLIRYLLNNKTGHSMIRNAEKVYLNDTNMAYALSNSIGKEVSSGSARELFAINQLQSAGYAVFSADSGDMAVTEKKSIFGKKYVFEIGGKNKDTKQIKNIKNSFLVLDNILHGDKYSIPLYLLGFLY